MGKLTDSWKYEKPEWGSDSQLKDRALFLRKLIQLRPQVITDLFSTAFVRFEIFAASRFSKFLDDIPLPQDNSFNATFKYLSNIPEQEIRIATIGGWVALQRMKRTKELRIKLQEWSEKHNLTAEWCLNHAIKVLRCWMYDDQHVRWLDVIPPALLTPERLAGELSAAWQDVINRMDFTLAYSRALLAGDVFQGEKGDPESFTFEQEGLRFESDGWNYLQEGNREWKKTVEQEFDRFKDQLKANDKPVPKGILTAFRKELAEYVKKQDAEKRAAIKQHGLVKRPRRYAEHTPEEHIKWLVMYQIPPCQKYGEIAEQANRSTETIRKCVAATAKRIDIKLRDDRLHAGRRAGEGGKSPRRITYRENSPRQKRNAEK